jgi:hypothetical protein
VRKYSPVYLPRQARNTVTPSLLLFLAPDIIPGLFLCLGGRRRFAGDRGVLRPK